MTMPVSIKPVRAVDTAGVINANLPLILAALRSYQHLLETGGTNAAIDSTILDGQIVAPDEIDELCEALVFGSTSTGPEQYRTVVVNIGHIRLRDAGVLSDAVGNGLQTVFERDSGFFIRLMAEVPESLSFEGQSDALGDLLAWAVREGYGAVQIDALAPVVEAFPVFDWDYEEADGEGL